MVFFSFFFLVFEGLITCCCPCITFGQIAEIVSKGSSSKTFWIFFFFFWGLNGWMRSGFLFYVYFCRLCDEWSSVFVIMYGWVAMLVFMCLQVKIEGSVWFGRVALCWLSCSLLLWGLLTLSRVQRAQAPWIWHGNRYDFYHLLQQIDPYMNLMGNLCSSPWIYVLRKFMFWFINLRIITNN